MGRALHLELSGSSGSPCEDAVSDLGGHVTHSSRTAREEHSARAVVGSDVAESLKVLRDQQELGNLLSGQLLPGAMGDRIPEAIDDCAALPGDTFSLELRRIGRRFCGFHHLDLLGLRCHLRCVTEALLLVDLVHRRDHLRVWGDFRDEGLVDEETKVGHLRAELLLNGIRDVVLLFKCFIESHLRDEGADDVRDVGLNLLVHVIQFVHRQLCVFRHHGLLHCNLAVHEDVVFGLGGDVHHVLLRTARDRSKANAAAAAV
mmetsp:Transcript_40102/g.74770  ORF Transcript_40102/g.74770 Transcript_40102/m.74770 type:complete len:260 (-) Transcript_40102:196-975(-)